MLFKSAILQQASGSVGGATYSHNAAGMYMRGRSLPVNPNTGNQVAVRGFFAQLAAMWYDLLTAVQREAWNNYAANVPVVNRVGDSINLAGMNWFIGANTLRLQAGLARVDDGPVVYQRAFPVGITTFAPSSASQNVAVTFTNTADWASTGGALLVYAGRPQPSSVNFWAGPYLYAGKIAGAGTPPTSPQNVDLPYPFETGDIVNLQVRYLNPDGRYSVPFRHRCVGVA